jgi:hypothetical protein
MTHLCPNDGGSGSVPGAVGWRSGIVTIPARTIERARRGDPIPEPRYPGAGLDRGGGGGDSRGLAGGSVAHQAGHRDCVSRLIGADTAGAQGLRASGGDRTQGQSRATPALPASRECPVTRTIGRRLPADLQLSGWAEIAAALRVSEAHARRLARREGLPHWVSHRRHEAMAGPRRGGRVWTTGELITAWLKGRALGLSAQETRTWLLRRCPMCLGMGAEA